MQIILILITLCSCVYTLIPPLCRDGALMASDDEHYCFTVQKSMALQELVCKKERKKHIFEGIYIMKTGMSLNIKVLWEEYLVM